MAKLKIQQGEWVVVCDGAKALVLENVGDEVFLNLRTREVYEPEPAPSLAADGTAMEQNAVPQETEDRFLEKVATRIDAAISGGQAKSLVLAAPPRALGILRQAYSQSVRRALRAEIDKDLVKLPLHEIEKHLAA